LAIKKAWTEIVDTRGIAIPVHQTTQPRRNVASCIEIGVHFKNGNFSSTKLQKLNALILFY